MSGVQKNQKQWRFLTKSAELGKLAHALLFSGPEGSGKKETALEFAKFLLNQDISRGVQPDFIMVEPTEDRIQISQIRELLNKLSLKPYSADLKVAVISRAHLMNREAQNCFLKFLEEPKGKTFLILVTAYPFLLLPTVVSRLQKIRFFSGREEQTEKEKKFISDLLTISNAGLVSRFQFAKEFSSENLKEILDAWLKYFRKILISRLLGSKKDDFSRYSLTKIKNIIKVIQRLDFLLLSSNLNSRLALEILLMEL